MPHRILIAAMAAATLAACSVRQENASQPAADTATDGPGDTGVAREAVPAPTPAPAVTAVAAAIQTQPGPEGNSVALNKVAVTGDILTVSMTFSGGSCCVHLPLDEVSVIDDATSQRISVLKDNSGKWIAAPLETSGKSVGPDSFSKPSVIWFKFPAPPATSKTVSITVPGVAPFDAVPVTR